MSECRECKMVSRRSLLKRAGVGLGAMAFADPLFQLVASTYAQSAGGTGNLLVLCQLNGGLDALEFLAPFKNSVYHSKRPQLGLSAEDVTPLPDNADLGINNQFPFFSSLYAQNQVASPF